MAGSALEEFCHYPAGRVLFAAQDTPAWLYLIVAGTVVLDQPATAAGGSDVEAVRVTAGDVLGETAMILNERHSLTARCVTDVKAYRIAADAFQRAVARSDRILAPLLRTLATRLRRSNAAMAQRRPAGQGVHANDLHRVEIELHGTSLVRNAGWKRARVGTYPFFITLSEPGMACRPSSGTASLPDLRLTGESDLAPARPHCGLYLVDGRLMLLDHWSALGTTLNGVHLTRLAHAGTGGLAPGDNRVQLGPPESPYSLSVHVVTG